MVLFLFVLLGFLLAIFIHAYAYTLCTATYTAGHMAGRSCKITTGEYEGTHLGQYFVHSIYTLFQPGYIRIVQVRQLHLHLLAGISSEGRAYCKKTVLYLPQFITYATVGAHIIHHTQERIQLIYSAVAFYAYMTFGHAH